MAATRQLLFGYTIKIGRENKEKEGRIKLKRDPAFKDLVRAGEDIHTRSFAIET